MLVLYSMMPLSDDGVTMEWNHQRGKKGKGTDAPGEAEQCSSDRHAKVPRCCLVSGPIGWRPPIIACHSMDSGGDPV
jgi:hypothetical protein